MTMGKVFDVILGIVGLGMVGMLIGTVLGEGWFSVTLVLGMFLGAGVGFLGGRGFFLSIFIGTVLGGLLALGLSGTEAVTVGAASGAAMGGFLGIWISMLLEIWQQRKQPLSKSAVERPGSSHP